LAEYFEIKRGDTSPALQVALLPVSVVLTGATVVFSMRARGTSTALIDRQPATIVTATGTPAVAYEWQAGDTDQTPGVYEGEFDVTYADATSETFPAGGYINILISGVIA